MEHIINTLIPIFTLIILGYTFKHLRFPSTEFWPMADKFTYYVLMPSLLIYKLARANIDIHHTINMVATTLLAITIVFFTLMVLNFFLKYEGKAFTSIMQGGIRFNSYVFLAFVDSVYGDKGLVYAAIILAFAIPYLNVLCISTFAIYTQRGEFSFKSFFKTIIKNPLIGACVIGGAINISGVYVPMTLLKTLSLLSAAALPIGLLSVGVGLEFKHLKSAKSELISSTFAKLIYFPAIIYGVGLLFGLHGMMLSVCVIFGAMPTAVSGYILARELGGDTTLMASIITVQTLACMGTIFLIIPIL